MTPPVPRHFRWVPLILVLAGVAQSPISACTVPGYVGYYYVGQYGASYIVVNWAVDGSVSVRKGLQLGQTIVLGHGSS
jgi:hypothetical protein